jgi:hypothetical protein
MREVIVTADSTGNTSPVVLDQYITPFQVTYASSNSSATVQVSNTDPYPVVNQKFTSPTFTWVSVPSSGVDGANALMQPYRVMRLTGGASGDTLTVVQSGVK